MKDVNVFLALALAAALAACAFLTVVLFQRGESDTQVVKITTASKFARVQGLMNYRFTGLKEASRQVVWDFQGTEVGEEDLFLSFEIKTKAQKKAFRDEAVKNGGKRLLAICYNMQSTSGEWSMGYCYNEPAPYIGAS